MTSSEVLWYCPLNFAFKAHQTDAFYFQMGTILFTGSMQPDDKDRKTSHQPWASKARHLKINLILLPLFSSSLVNIWSASGPVSKCKSYGFSLVFYTKRKKERLWGEPRENAPSTDVFCFFYRKGFSLPLPSAWLNHFLFSPLFQTVFHNSMASALKQESIYHVRETKKRETKAEHSKETVWPLTCALMPLLSSFTAVVCVSVCVCFILWQHTSPSHSVAVVTYSISVDSKWAVFLECPAKWSVIYVLFSPLCNRHKNLDPDRIAVMP